MVFMKEPYMCTDTSTANTSQTCYSTLQEIGKSARDCCWWQSTSSSQLGVQRVNPTHPTSSNIWELQDSRSLTPVNSPNGTQWSWLPMLGGGRRDRISRSIIRKKKEKNEPPLPVKIQRQMISKGLVSKETVLVCLSFRPLSHLLLELPGISCGHVRMYLFSVLTSHSLPLHFLSFSFFNLHPLPDTESLPGNQSALHKYVHSLWEGGFHTAQMTHITQKVFSSFLDHCANSSVVFFVEGENKSSIFYCLVLCG